MRACDQDLIRGGHYGQRSCEPHLQAEHMAASTNAATVKKALANSEPSTHGTERTCRRHLRMSAIEGRPDDNCSVRAFPVLMWWTAPTLRHRSAIGWLLQSATTMRGAVHGRGYHDWS